MTTVLVSVLARLSGAVRSRERRFTQKVSHCVITSLCCTWKSGRRLGRPSVAQEVRALIRQIAQENPLWGAPRIHGELFTLGVQVSQATVAKYLARRVTPPSQAWRTFLANHMKQLV